MRKNFEQYADEIAAGLAADTAPSLRTISAATLQQTYLPPVKFVVQGLIPHGLTILAAPPKFGKSWAMLDLACSVAAGRPWLGFQTSPASVLYLALEDSPARLKSRTEKILDGRPAPASVDFCTEAPALDNGLLAELDTYIAANPATGLIIIDTLQRVRGTPKSSKENGYSTDYRELGALKQFADNHGVALVLVHHLRKMAADGDPFDRISGTNGVFGAADTAIVLTREKRSDTTTTMTATGRDIDGLEQAIQFNKETCRWENLGGADWFNEQQRKKAYNDSPVVKQVKALLVASPEGWTGTATQFMQGTNLNLTPQALNKKLRDLDFQLLENDGISHAVLPNGNAGSKHRFTYPCNDSGEPCNVFSNVFPI